MVLITMHAHSIVFLVQSVYTALYFVFFLWQSLLLPTCQQLRQRYVLCLRVTRHRGGDPAGFDKHKHEESRKEKPGGFDNVCGTILMS